jgi:hypothetical protein
MLLLLRGEGGIECDLLWQKADIESQAVGIRRSYSPSRSSSPLTHNALARRPSTIMDKPQDQQLTGANSHQQRARSFPIFEPQLKARKTMGWAARTPSPPREPYYASGKLLFLSHITLTNTITPGDELAPTSKSHLGRAMILDTPPGSPPSAFAEPATPAFKHEPLKCFGLLTPKTPSFGDLLVQPPVSPSDDDSSTGTRAICLQSEEQQDVTSKGINFTSSGSANGDMVEEEVLVVRTRDLAAQQEIRDTALAASLLHEVEAPSRRRSNRLAVKEVTKGELQFILASDKHPSNNLVAPDPIAAIAVVPGNSTKVSMPGLAVQFTKRIPPESSFTAEAVVQLPSDINPALMTLDWQLQYPPGGSTHPSYAYPQMHPRLFFNPALVPIVNGLPTVFQVPPLVLPMGWRHISWSGFLPIVFDPYHQAFKLTPVGPLPLTCEEVQQGGLAKYVPGGEAHPEAGLLPDVTALSDGSADEIYNFEDVDWVLPWPKGETFTPLVEIVLGTSASPSTQAKSKHTAEIAPRPHCYEARDCPDNVVDIDDGWRWLKEKEVNPHMIYIASPGKTWHGTGIHKTTRKHKAPIASLMGMVISDIIASPGEPLAKFLLSQNGREFCTFRSVATPVHVDITFLKDIEITLIELLSYFPNHYWWRKASDRLVRAGFTGSSIANTINWSRNLQGEAVLNISTVGDQISWEHVEIQGSKQRIKIVREPETESATYTTED